MQEMDTLIQKYARDDNANKKLIRLKLELINSLCDAKTGGQEDVFLQEIVKTFLEIVELQRRELEDRENIPIQAPSLPQGLAPAHNGDFRNDKQLQAAFAGYLSEKGLSSYTINDYCSRLRNLWRSFYKAYREGELPDIAVTEERLEDETPLCNAFHHLDSLYFYVRKMEYAAENKRNWANIAAALNQFTAFADR